MPRVLRPKPEVYFSRINFIFAQNHTPAALSCQPQITLVSKLVRNVPFLIAATFYYLCSVLDGYSRYVVHWEIRESMTEAEVELILQRAREQFPQASPRIISDNGPQFIARDFKEFIRMCGMTHVRTSPFYPQSNGKIERWHQSLKSECVRPGVPLSIDDARRLVERYVNYYNRVRLHSAIGYVTPRDKLEGREAQI